MRKIHIAFALAILLSTQAVLANDMYANKGSCASIAKACAKAGFGRGETTKKKFWQNCMKPLILGQTVAGVTIDADVIKQCRSDKIDQLKQELENFQKAS